MSELKGFIKTFEYLPARSKWTMTVNKECRNCIFLKITNNTHTGFVENLFCVKNAPLIKWPEVNADDFCGDYSHDTEKIEHNYRARIDQMRKDQKDELIIE